MSSDGERTLQDYADSLKELAESVEGLIANLDLDGADPEGFTGDVAEDIWAAIIEEAQDITHVTHDFIIEDMVEYGLNLIEEEVANKFLTYSQVVQMYRNEVLPGVIKRYEIPHLEHTGHSRIDVPARQEAWNNFTDYLCKDGQITRKQYDNWCLPNELEG